MAKHEQKGIVLKRKHIVLLAVLFIILVAGGIYLGLYLARGNGPDGGFVIDPHAKNASGTVSSGESVSGEISLPGYPQIPVIAGQKNISVELLNPAGNPCYFKYTLVLKDTGSAVYLGLDTARTGCGQANHDPGAGGGKL